MCTSQIMSVGVLECLRVSLSITHEYFYERCLFMCECMWICVWELYVYVWVNVNMNMSTVCLRASTCEYVYERCVFTSECKCCVYKWVQVNMCTSAVYLCVNACEYVQECCMFMCECMWIRIRAQCVYVWVHHECVWAMCVYGWVHVTMYMSASQFVCFFISLKYNIKIN